MSERPIVGINYKSIEYRLHESLVQMQKMLSILGFDQALQDSLDKCKDLIKNKQYNIAVMGEFKRGKSSLINALLGAKILPVDATPATATINRITYGDKPGAIITFIDGKTQEIQISELTDYITRITADSEARALRIKEAAVYFPTVICQNHIDIIDTPGLNDEARMTQITINMISNVDAVVVPIHARSPFSETEKKFVCQLIESEGIYNLMFVVTFMDQLDEDDYEYGKYMEYIKSRIKSEVFSELDKRQSPEKIIRRAHLLLDDLEISGVSSALALESFVSNNRELLKKSRFEEFNQALLRVATAKQLENAVRKTVENIRVIVPQQFEAQNRKRREFFTAEAGEINKCEEAVKQYCAESKKMLDTAFSVGYDKLQEIVNSINKNKNNIVTGFIKDLSQISENTHSAIYTAMRDSGEKIRIELAGQNEGLRNEIYQVFLSAASYLQEQSREKLSIIAKFAGISDLTCFDHIKAPMLSFAGTALSGVVFSWSVPYIPPDCDLAERNVIETVINAADVSIANYIKAYDQVLITIRKNWFEQFSAYTEALSASVLSVIEHRNELHDLQYKAYLRNYQAFAEDAQEILRQCEALLEETEKG